jgi:amidase
MNTQPRSKKPTWTRREFLQLTAAGSMTLGLGACAAKGPEIMMNPPLHYQTLTAVADRIASGDLTASAATEALLTRMAALEPRLHTYYTVLGERARERAAAADAAQAAGEPLGPLHGVPIAVKDLCHLTGHPTTAGHSFRRNNISTTDATVVARLEAAGAIILGKLATTEGAMVGYHRDFAVPRNPWGDLDRWPGVSSGGSGAAPAAGLCFASLGTDTGGSIRYPSAANGLVGLKPTWGRVSRHGVLDLAPTLDHIGPMTRSVRDAARVLGVIAGHDHADPTSLSATVPNYEAAIDKGVTGLRIGWDEAYATKDVEAYVADAVRGAVASLAEAGATIVEVDVPEIPQAEGDAWTTLASAEAAAVHEATYPERSAEYGTYFREFLAGGHALTPVQLAKAVIARRVASGRMAPVFDNIHVLVSPTLASESFRYNPDDAYGGFDSDNNTLAGVPLTFFQKSGRFVSIWDYNGYPTLSMPCGFSPDGIPLSLQFVGPPLAEADLCRAGFAYEQAHEWHLAHPDLA